MQDLIAGKREKFKWRLMVVADAEWITNDRYEDAIELASKRLGTAPTTLRMETYMEGSAAQIMHIGPPANQTSAVARMYHEFLPNNQLVPHSYYHEIYLNDSRRTAPEQLKTVLRQPVK